MAYSVSADVQQAIGGAARLLQLADHDGNGVIDTGVVDDAIAEADAIINSYARKVREVPISPIPEIIKRMSANLTVWVLKRRRGALDDTDVINHQDDIQWLTNLSVGKVDLGVNPAPAASPHNVPTVTERPCSKAVSRESMKGFA
jgi:phage gp36-like protein